MRDPQAASQPSWAFDGRTIGGVQRGRLGEPALLAGLTYIVIVDSLVIFAILVGSAFTPDARTSCNAARSFCFDDPVPAIDNNRMAIAVFAVGLIASMIACLAVRRAVIVVVVVQALLLVGLVAHDRSALRGAEHRQDLLRACHYGASGSCPGITNLERDP
jgi:lysylphosphatidylglycerol synthetase-like protein (DUF2156 family)